MLIFSREEGGNSQEPELHDIRDLVRYTAVHARVSNYNYNYVFTRIDCYGRMTVRATLHMHTWDRAVKKLVFISKCVKSRLCFSSSKLSKSIVCNPMGMEL